MGETVISPFLQAIENLLKNSLPSEESTQETSQVETVSHFNQDDPEIAQKHIENENLKTDIQLKKTYACQFKWILIVQLAVMNVIFICIGIGWLTFSDLTIQLYLGGTLTEVFGIVFIMCRYLFSKH